MTTEFEISESTPDESTPRISLDANTALALFMAMRDTVDGALELTLHDANGNQVVFLLDADCHEHLPAEAGQADLALDAE